MATRLVRRSIVPPIAIAAALFAGGFAWWERHRTAANVDQVDYYQRFAGGFLAIGHASGQPGFVALSLLDRVVAIEAISREDILGGKRTRLAIASPAGVWRHRLREALVILIDDAGRIQAVETYWSGADFARIAAAADCSDPTRPHKRCGQPFEDIQAAIPALSGDPDLKLLREFLAMARKQ